MLAATGKRGIEHYVDIIKARGDYLWLNKEHPAVKDPANYEACQQLDDTFYRGSTVLIAAIFRGLESVNPFHGGTFLTGNRNCGGCDKFVSGLEGANRHIV